MKTKNNPQVVKHTPGPWSLLHRENGPTPFGISGPSDIIPGGFKELGVVYGGLRADEYGANARLIAAAPDLLDATRLALDTIEYLEQDRDTIQAIQVLRAAIAKAEGGN